MDRRRIKSKIRTICLLLLASFCAAAQSVSVYAAENIGEVREAYARGTRIFDEAELLSASEAERLSATLRDTEEETSFDLLVYTTDAYDGVRQAETFTTAEDLADYIYYEGGFGAGEEKSGVLFLIDMESREYFFYTKGDAVRYLTDSALDRMSEYDVVPCLSDGDYAGAVEAFAADTEAFFRSGIQEGQYNYNTETGERDYAPAGRRGIALWQLITALLFGAGIAYLPCRSVMKSYAMEKEKRLAEGFSLAYRADAGFYFMDQDAPAKLINRYVTTVPLPKVRSNPPHGGGMGGGIGSFGGGRSSMSIGRGGGMHGGRGGKF
ncbi:MAG: TPM domain-containing protein [Eubacteriales bacterium]|nr:TPM domain-containing protein [Eubacteriales bacterium]